MNLGILIWKIRYVCLASSWNALSQTSIQSYFKKLFDWRARIVMVNNDSSSLVRFSNFAEVLRQTNCGVPLRIDRPTMLKRNSYHMTSLAEETGHYFLRSDFTTNNLRWIWLGFRNPHGGLLPYFALIRTYPWFVTCDDHVNVFWGTAIVFFQHSFTPIDTNLFLIDCLIVRYPTRTNIFYGKVFMQYWMNSGGRNAQGWLYLTVCHMTILHYQFTHGINAIWHNSCFWTTITDFVFEWASAAIEFI